MYTTSILSFVIGVKKHLDDVDSSQHFCIRNARLYDHIQHMHMQDEFASYARITNVLEEPSPSTVADDDDSRKPRNSGFQVVYGGGLVLFTDMIARVVCTTTCFLYIMTWVCLPKGFVHIVVNHKAAVPGTSAIIALYVEKIYQSNPNTKESYIDIISSDVCVHCNCTANII